MAQFERHPPGAASGGERVEVPFYTVNYDFRLRPAEPGCRSGGLPRHSRYAVAYLSQCRIVNLRR